MKKFFALILILSLSCGMLVACGAEGGSSVTTLPTVQATQATQATTQPVVTEPYDPLEGNKTLRVLAIGNSFSSDTTHFLEDIARAEGFENIHIGNLYVSGCKLDQHASNASQNASAYKYYMNYSGTWETIEGSTIRYALQQQEWDFITMQQGSSASGRPETFEPHLTKLIEYVNANKLNPQAQLVWNMTWAYQSDFEKSMFDNYGRDQMLMYNAILNTVQEKVVPHGEISFIIPVGTAIQNARTSYLGDTLTRDGYHLSELGRVIASYTWLAKIMGKPLEAINFTNVSETLTLTDADKLIIIESVNNALANPYEITQSVYTTAPENGG